MFVRLKMLTKASCPYCLSTHVRRSHRRFYEKPLSLFGPHPFRCLRCYARCWKLVPPRRLQKLLRFQSITAKVKQYRPIFLNLVVNVFRLTLGFSIIVFVLTLMLFVAVWMHVQPAFACAKNYLPSNPVRLMRMKEIGTLALLLFVVLVVTFLWFKELPAVRMGDDHWRITRSEVTKRISQFF